MTEVDFDQISSYERYKLMASLIVPRPIALVTSLGANGVVNAAPFSMFNMIGEDPPILMISINRLQDGQLKDTSTNILHNGEFVVHMSDYQIALITDPSASSNVKVGIIYFNLMHHGKRL